jgi:hypothetical protein
MVTNPIQKSIRQQAAAMQGKVDVEFGPYIGAAPTSLDYLIQAKALPDVVGPTASPKLPDGTPNPLYDIKSIYDPAFKTYVENLSFKEQDSFISRFTGTAILYPELNVVSTQDGGLFGLVQGVAGEGLGILGKGLDAFDLASRATEQGMGILTSLLTHGFGNDLTIQERATSGKLFWESLGGMLFGGPSNQLRTALDLASVNDESFNKYVEDNQGGFFNDAIRVVADPLWLVGGVPLIPGAMKIVAGAKGINGSRVAAGIVGTSDFLARGVRATDIPVFGRLIQAGVEAEGPLGFLARTIATPLSLIGLPVEARFADQLAKALSVDATLGREILTNNGVASALNQSGNRGILGGILKLRPDMAADTLSKDALRLFEALVRAVDDPAAIKIILKDWQNATNLPRTVRASQDMFNLVGRLDVDNLVSLKKGGDGWKEMFLGELVSGQTKTLGRVATKKGVTRVLTSTDPSNSLRRHAMDIFGVMDDSPGAALRVLNPIKKFLGMTILNNPGYVMLNFINNMFTAGFDALEMFNWDPYGTLRVATPLRAFTAKHQAYMAGRFGENWKSVRDAAADGSGWMIREFGSAPEQLHIWDNLALNFGVRVAHRVDIMARNMAAELGMLRSDHYLNRFLSAGGIFDDLPEDLQWLNGLSPTEIIAKRAELSNGVGFGLISLRQHRERYFERVLADMPLEARLAARETLEVHLRGHLDQLEQGIMEAIQAGDRVAARNLIAKSKAEMKIWQQHASKYSFQSANTPPVSMESIYDITPLDNALLHDEFVFWNGQMNMVLDATGAYTGRIAPAARGRAMASIRENFEVYSASRHTLLNDYADAVADENWAVAKRIVDDLAEARKRYKEDVRQAIEDVVNRIARVDIEQARIFRNSTRRFQESIDYDMAVETAMRSAYWPSRKDPLTLNDDINDALMQRATRTRAAYGENVNEFRVGSFAPPPVASEAPMLNNRFNIYNDEWQAYADDLSENLDDIWEQGNILRAEADFDKAAEFIDNVLLNNKLDYEWARGKYAKMVADFTMLDYGHQYGFEKFTQFVFPYQFWPTRTAWHWAQRALAHPASVGLLWKIKEGLDEYQDSVNERYINDIRKQLITGDDFEFVENFLIEGRASHPDEIDTDEDLGYGLMLRALNEGVDVEQAIDKVNDHLRAHNLRLDSSLSEEQQEAIVAGFMRVRDQLEKTLAVQAELVNANALAGRMKNKVHIPVPFLNDMLKKVGLPTGFYGSIAFDPYAAMFPLVQWDRDYDFDKEPGNAFGMVFQQASDLGVSTNPFLKTAMSLTGLLPEGETAFDWLRNTGSPAASVLGFGGLGQAAYRWFSLGEEGPMTWAEDAVGEPIREFFIEHGYGGPGILRALAAEITGADPRDELSFEIYFTSRMLASLVADDPRLLRLEKDRVRRKGGMDPLGGDALAIDEEINLEKMKIAREYVLAYHEQSGPLWDKARKYSATQEGLRDVSKWLFGMGGANIWLPGEVTQTGLEFLEDAVLNTGTRDEYFEFLDQYPEFSSRKIQDTVLRNKEEAARIARERLYFWDTELVIKGFQPRIDALTEKIDNMTAAIEQLEAGGLNLRVVREQRGSLFDARGKLFDERSALYDERQVKFDRIETLYGKPLNSFAKNPVDRALDEVEDQWYKTFRIEDSDERRAAQEQLLSRFPAGNGAQGILDWLVLGAKAAAARETAFERGLDQENEIRNNLVVERNNKISGLTSLAMGSLTRRQVEEHIGLEEQGPPTPVLAEYRQAQSLFQTYLGFGEMGLTEEEERERKRTFWDSNPLLEKYYGLPSYQGHPDEAIQTALSRWHDIWRNAPEDGQERRDYIDKHEKEIDTLKAQLGPAGLIKPDNPQEARLAEIWDGYFALPDKSQERRDYINQFRDEIDQLNSVLGKKPSPGQLDASRENQIWTHYFSLPKGSARRSYLYLVAIELNEIRARLGKDPIVLEGFELINPRLSDSSPLEIGDLVQTP